MRETPARTALQNGVVTLAALSLLGWGLILWSVANMSAPVVTLMMPMGSAWAIPEIFAVSLMWSVMMGAMMLPSAIPMLVIHRRLSVERDPGTPGAGRWFLTGYLVTWTGFSLAAVVLHWGFQRADILSPMVKLQDAFVSAAILIAAGVYQLTPLKAVSLNHCRTPETACQADWRSGRLGALRMGLDRGLCCIGCCWALMLVLFVGGVMSLTTIAVLTLVVSVEKLAPRGVLLAKLGCVPLVAWGVWLIAGAMGAAPAVL